jgi:hypothetical protein
MHSLYEPLVFLNKVEIVPSDNDCTVHLSTVACTSQDTTSNGHASSEGALLVNVSSYSKSTISLDSYYHEINNTNLYTSCINQILVK